LQSLSDWLDHADQSQHWVGPCRNRIVQVRETFGSLADFESILGKLNEYGHKRMKPTSPTTYGQNELDIMHDCTERLRGVDCGNPDEPAQGFYPQYLRSDLILALREFFHQTEQNRARPTAYADFAARKIDMDSVVISLNYDVALERSQALGNGILAPDTDLQPSLTERLRPRRSTSCMEASTGFSRRCRKTRRL
jgi:hypothetical protein